MNQVIRLVLQQPGQPPQQPVPIPLHEGKIHIWSVKQTFGLASLQKITETEPEGLLMYEDSQGWSLETFVAGGTVKVCGIPSPGNVTAIGQQLAGNVTAIGQQLQEMKLEFKQYTDKAERFMSDSSNTTVDASKVTGDDIEQIDRALNVARQSLTAVNFERMKADVKPQYKLLPSAEDSKEQVPEVMNLITKHLLTEGLDESFCLLDVNRSGASNFPRATFSNLPRHYRGRADYLIVNSCYREYTDPVFQRRMALVAFEVKKDLSTQEEAIYMAQARLGFFTYGSQSNAALLYVLTDLVKGGVLFWAKQDEQELQVFEEAVSGMKQLYQLVRNALQDAPIVSRHDAASATARSCIHKDTKTLKHPDRDRFRIVGYQHPRQSPGQLLMNIEDKAYSTADDDQDIRAWYPDEDAEDPLVYPCEELKHMSMFS